MSNDNEFWNNFFSSKSNNPNDQTSSKPDVESSTSSVLVNPPVPPPPPPVSNNYSKLNDFTKITDIFLNNELANMPVIEGVDTSNRRWKNAEETASFFIDDVVEYMQKLTTISPTNKLITVMINVKKLLTNAIYLDPGRPYVKGTILYLLGQKKIKTNGKKGKLAEIKMDENGEIFVDEGEVLRNEVRQGIGKIQKDSNVDFDQSDKIDDKRDDDDDEDEPDPRELMKIFELKTKKIQFMKEFTKKNIESWCYSKLNTLRFLKYVGGSIYNDLLNTLVYIDLTKMIFNVWTDNIETVADTKTIQEIEQLGLGSLEKVDLFIKEIKKGKNEHQRSVCEYLKMDEKDPLKLIQLMFSASLFVAFTSGWNIVYAMFNRLKKQGGGKAGFSKYYDYFDDNGIPGVNFILKPVDMDPSSHCQSEFAKFVAVIFALQSEDKHSTVDSHYKYFNHDSRYKQQLFILCAKLSDLGFTGISPQLN